MPNTEVILVHPDGSISDEVHILSGIYALEAPGRDLKKLIMFLKISRGVTGLSQIFLDEQCTKQLTDENYAENNQAKKLYYKLNN